MVFAIPLCVKMYEAGINTKRDIEHILVRDAVRVDMTAPLISLASVEETYRRKWPPNPFWLPVRLGHPAIAFEVLICAFSRVSHRFVSKPRVFTRFRCALPMLGCASRPERAPDNFITKLRGNL